MIPFLDLRCQYETIKPEIDGAIASVIRESAFVGGRYVEIFEEQFAHYQQVGQCIGVGNGTDAIEIALEAMALPPGSEVLVPANSFIATAEAVTRTGLRVVFCDSDPDSYTISLEDAAGRVTPRTSAIIAVHLYGQSCDMDGVRELASRYGLKVIEDCAQAHGGEYRGRRLGGIGDVGTFSFYPGKNLGAYGDGGAIVSNDTALAKKCRMIANHGRTGKYNHEFEGRNSRLDGLQAAILGVKLRYLDDWIEKRKRTAEYYLKQLRGISDLILPKQGDWGRHVWHLFVIRTSRRSSLRQYLNEKGIQTGVHYPIALPKLRAYSYLGQGNEPMFANKADSEILSIPMGEHLEDEELLEIVSTIKKFYS